MTKEQILQKHFTAEFGHDRHSKFMQYILNAMEEYAQQQVKNLNIPYGGMASAYHRSKFEILNIEIMKRIIQKLKKAFAIPRVSNCPSELESVLAKIEHINSLGKSTWYEVVYFDGHWRCYAGSNTFKDGEKVIKWRYCKDCC